MGTFSLEGSREKRDRGTVFQFNIWFLLKTRSTGVHPACSIFSFFPILIWIILHFHGDFFFGRVIREERDRANRFNRHYWIPLLVTNLKNSEEYLIVKNITKFNYPYLSTGTINVFWETFAFSMRKSKSFCHVLMHTSTRKNKISKLHLSFILMRYYYHLS